MLVIIIYAVVECTLLVVVIAFFIKTNTKFCITIQLNIKRGLKKLVYELV